MVGGKIRKQDLILEIQSGQMPSFVQVLVQSEYKGYFLCPLNWINAEGVC